MIEINKVYNMDCIDGIGAMVQQGVKVDAIITDPPYNISRENNFNTMGRNGIDFGDWDKEFDQFLWIAKSYELVKDGGTLFLFNDWKNVGEIGKFSESIGYQIKDMVRWRKLNPMPRNRDRRYITDFEVAIWLVKPKGKWVFNRLSDTYDRCEYNYPIISNSEREGHPNQKPIKLMEEILKRHTNEGQLILDPFIGSGSTITACINTNRNYIGFEKEKDYYNMANKRIKGVKNENK